MMLLGIFKVIGFLIAGASTIWGLTQRTTRDDETGAKRLTAAGQVAVALAACSFLVATVSTGFETIANRTKAERETEAQRIRALTEATDRAVVEGRERRRDQQSLQEVADARLRALEQRATAAEQRALLLASADAERRRGDAELRRDFALSRSVYDGSQRNLTRTGEALTQLERVLQPLERLTVRVEWQLDADIPATEAAMASFIDLGRRVRTGEPAALAEAGLESMSAKYAARIQQFQLVESSSAYPTLGRDRVLSSVVRPQGRVSLFAVKEPIEQGLAAMMSEPASAGSPLYAHGDLRFGLQTGRALLTYDIGRRSLWWEATVRPEAILRSTGAIVSVPDLERAILALNVTVGKVLQISESEKVRQLLLRVRPRSATILVAGRAYRLPAHRFERLLTKGGDPIFIVRRVGPPTN